MNVLRPNPSKGIFSKVEWRSGPLNFRRLPSGEDTGRETPNFNQKLRHSWRKPRARTENCASRRAAAPTRCRAHGIPARAVGGAVRQTTASSEASDAPRKLLAHIGCPDFPTGSAERQNPGHSADSLVVSGIPLVC